jgi:branched-subunit amino acid aminotransferase/4-amino-4-deoxychorismate lyase
MESYCYLSLGRAGGEILPVSEAKVGVYDIGLLRGFGVYEALRTVNSVPFMFADHMARFHRSTDALKLHIPESDERIRAIIAELIERNIPSGKDAIVRFIITGGEAIGGIEYNPQTPTFYILVEELYPLDDEVLQKGCKLIVHEHQRVFPEFKTTNYVAAVLLQEERKKQGALEILYTYRGKVLEPATSNLFIVSKGIIVTAKDDILAGITRKVAIDVAKKEFQVEERSVSVDEMYAADEAFLTSSFKDIVPVVEVGGRTIGTGVPGPVTKRVMELFREFMHTYGQS